ncbi:MAG: hypothetical protein K0U74_16640 [Alphaproteobacteria bacterium]|nr:hypothetical protein [Alphaproteobacteria bacterium]
MTDTAFLAACRRYIRADFPNRPGRKEFNEADWLRLRRGVCEHIYGQPGIDIPYAQEGIDEEHFLAWGNPCFMNPDAEPVEVIYGCPRGGTMKDAS